MKKHLAYFACMLLIAVLNSKCWAQVPPEFHVSLSSELNVEAVSGRLYVFITSSEQKTPMLGPDWFSPEPFAALDVVDMKPGQTVILNDQADCFPNPMSQWPQGKYRVQAILDHDFYFPAAAAGPGNYFSEVVNWQSDLSALVHLRLDQAIPEVPYPESTRVKFVERVSQRLSEHFGRDIIDRAAVILPESYDSQPDRRYPVYYEVTGFGGSLRSIARRGPNPRRRGNEEIEFIQVILTGECKNGHHVYANSSANGPRGDALVFEMIPHIDQLFRTISDADARFVGGHSSGGWSSLWLQVNYPDAFGAVFSTSPDPVDFRDFQGTDLYATPSQSVFRDVEGDRRPLARHGTQVLLWYDDFCKMDQVLGRGGQMSSFDAVFSPLDADGHPQRCWDPTTGQVNPQVVEHWQRYDISWLIAQNWDQLRDKLAGKIHVAMGELDTFYLEGATRLMAERLAELGSDAQIEFIPEASHNLPASVIQGHRQAMREKFATNFNTDGSRK